MEKIDGVIVIFLGDVTPVYFLALVEFLLVREHVRVEVLLQTLVRLVDAQLLKAVVVKDLEALYVE